MTAAECLMMLWHRKHSVAINTATTPFEKRQYIKLVGCNMIASTKRRVGKVPRPADNPRHTRAQPYGLNHGLIDAHFDLQVYVRA